MIRHVFANRSNVGDWLSAKGVQALLAPMPVTEHLCDEPFVPETLRALGDAPPDDLVVIGGGGLLMDYFTPFWEGFLALRPARRFVLWGAGVVDLKAEPTLPPAALLREIADRALLVLVRDERTREVLGRSHVPPPVPCPSFAALAPAPPRERGLLHAANLTTVGEPAYDAMRAAGLRFAEETGRDYRETNHRIRPDSEADLAAVLDVYARSDRVLASRLHACIFAVALGRPVLAVSGDRKVEGFMDAAGLGAWIVEPSRCDTLAERLATLKAQPRPAGFRERVVAAHRAFAAEVLRAATP